MEKYSRLRLCCSSVPHSTTRFPKNGKIYYCTRRLRSCLIAQSSRPLQHQLWASVLQTLNHQTVDYLSVTSQVLLKRVTQPPSAGEQLVTSTLRSTPPPHPDERRGGAARPRDHLRASPRVTRRTDMNVFMPHTALLSRRHFPKSRPT